MAKGSWKRINAFFTNIEVEKEEIYPRNKH